MSAEDFLKRWSRRKRTAVREPPQAAPPIAEEATAPLEIPALPPVESIEAGSDISAFLAPGVPTALSQAALRRAWSADPAIRDFIGLSENSWDFNAVGGVPGFGAIDPDSVERLLGRVIGTPEESETAAAAPHGGDETQAPEPSAALASPENVALQQNEESNDLLPEEIHAATQDIGRAGETLPATPARRHGGALPE